MRKETQTRRPRVSTVSTGLALALLLCAGFSSMAFSTTALSRDPGRPQALGAGANDFVTGGGWIDGTPSGARGNFGFKAGADAGGAFGQLNFLDHDARLHVKSEEITSYVALDAITREVQGTARIGKQTGLTFTLVVSDAGEPGTADTFALTLSNGYAASSTLVGGNVQLHPRP